MHTQTRVARAFVSRVRVYTSIYILYIGDFVMDGVCACEVYVWACAYIQKSRQ